MTTSPSIGHEAAVHSFNANPSSEKQTPLVVHGLLQILDPMFTKQMKQENDEGPENLAQHWNLWKEDTNQILLGLIRPRQ